MWRHATVSGWVERDPEGSVPEGTRWAQKRRKVVYVARGSQRRSGARRTTQRPQQRSTRRSTDEGLIPQLARTVRQVESAVQMRSIAPSVRTKFQVVALLAREERNRIKADTSISESRRGEELKRLDGIATILAQTAALDSTLFELLGDNAVETDATRALIRELKEAAGLEAEEELEEEDDLDGEVATVPEVERRVVPRAVISRQLANPFLTPDFSGAAQQRPRQSELARWELLGPLFKSFEQADSGAVACMDLPEPTKVKVPDGLELMRHQARFVAAVAEGHRSFLLADEPGLGKTAQALLAAQAANAYPLLVVVPNVVKTTWAREAEQWTPRHPASVIQGNGDTLDAFADIMIVNYEVLDRHVGWLTELGFRGMVVDEAHFIKNKSSQRSQHVLEVADSIRKRMPRPLLMALTGTPLINDIDDFRAIWQFLGWIDDRKPLATLMDALDDIGLTPLDPGFYPRARRAVIDRGIVRRRKAEVASDIPERRIADLPVELEGEAGRSIRAAEAELARRLVARYDSALATRKEGVVVEGIDHDLVRRVAGWEREDTAESSGENVFELMRRIGQAKAALAADYTAQLARSVGKVVFFAKHIDVMDVAQETFAKQGIRYSSIRGDQTPKVRQQNIDAFINDPEVAVVVCSLTAAGVGLNLQVASNVVLAELSWTAAEQTQAIDRVHRIGQDDPVTAWRMIAAQTIDSRIAELIDSKAGLAARALDGSDEDVVSSVDLQLEALVTLLTDALEARG